MNDKEKQCVAYFRSAPVFERLLQGFRDKYRSYGEFSGTVLLKFRSQQEREVLEGFLQKNYHGKKTASISAAAFQSALDKSRFEGISGKTLLELYFQEPMTGKREEREAKDRQWEQMLDRTRMLCCGQETALEWLDALGGIRQDTGGFGTYLRRREKEQAGEGERLLRLGVQLLLEFEEKRKQNKAAEYLPVFASRLTGNPHAFDDNQKDGQYFGMLVHWWTIRQGVFQGSGIFPAVQKKMRFLAAGILRDEVSNYAMLCGITARKKDGTFHAGIQGFAKEGEMVQVPLAVLSGWEEISCPENEIFIVENPSVYAALCMNWKGTRAVMCMNGQPRLSAVLTLDLLARGKIRVWYGGDFDPEGLLIAQKLRQYYKGEFHYWNMSAEDYQAARSRQEISQKRLSMLNRITDPQLQKTAEAIREEKYSGYQENIWERIVGAPI